MLNVPAGILTMMTRDLPRSIKSDCAQELPARISVVKARVVMRHAAIARSLGQRYCLRRCPGKLLESGLYAQKPVNELSPPASKACRQNARAARARTVSESLAPHPQSQASPRRTCGWKTEPPEPAVDRCNGRRSRP